MTTIANTTATPFFDLAMNTSQSTTLASTPLRYDSDDKQRNMILIASSNNNNTCDENQPQPESSTTVGECALKVNPTATTTFVFGGQRIFIQARRQQQDGSAVSPNDGPSSFSWKFPSPSLKDDDDDNETPDEQATSPFDFSMYQAELSPKSDSNQYYFGLAVEQQQQQQQQLVVSFDMDTDMSCAELDPKRDAQQFHFGFEVTKSACI